MPKGTSVLRTFGWWREGVEGGRDASTASTDIDASRIVVATGNIETLRGVDAVETRRETSRRVVQISVTGGVCSQTRAGTSYEWVARRIGGVDRPGPCGSRRTSRCVQSLTPQPRQRMCTNFNKRPFGCSTWWNALSLAKQCLVGANKQEMLSATRFRCLLDASSTEPTHHDTIDAHACPRALYSVYRRT